jgi:hypothetical protein
MKDAHLTLRIPASLARTLDKIARVRGVSKSHLVADAIARHVTSATPPSEPARRVSGAEFSSLWPSLPRLAPGDANAFAEDIARARKELPPPADRWG